MVSAELPQMMVRLLHLQWVVLDKVPDRGQDSNKLDTWFFLKTDPASRSGTSQPKSRRGTALAARGHATTVLGMLDAGRRTSGIRR